MADFTNEYVLERIQTAHPEAVKNVENPLDGMLCIELTRDNLIPIVKFLRDDEALEFIFLTDLTGIHYPDNVGRELGVVYHLHSLVHNFRLRIKVFFPVADPHIPTLTGLYSGANWMERETYDFYGVLFDGHPDLRRILNVDEMDYFPLRKEFRLEDGTRIDKDDRYFGRDGHVGVAFD